MEEIQEFYHLEEILPKFYENLKDIGGMWEASYSLNSQTIKDVGFDMPAFYEFVENQEQNQDQDTDTHPDTEEGSTLDIDEVNPLEELIREHTPTTATTTATATANATGRCPIFESYYAEKRLEVQPYSLYENVSNVVWTESECGRYNIPITSAMESTNIEKEIFTIVDVCLQCITSAPQSPIPTLMYPMIKNIIDYYGLAVLDNNYYLIIPILVESVPYNTEVLLENICAPLIIPVDPPPSRVLYRQLSEYPAFTYRGMHDSNSNMIFDIHAMEDALAILLSLKEDQLSA